MKLFTWVLFACSVLLVGWSVRRRWSYRRRGEPVPWQFAGNIAGGLGIVSLLAAALAPSAWLNWVFLSAALTLMATDAVVFTRARRKALGAPAA
jgi:hypothetical protein